MIWCNQNLWHLEVKSPYKALFFGSKFPQDASGIWNLKEIEKKILDDIEPLLKEMGISIVELNAAVVKKTFTIRLVIFQDQGVTLKDCEAVHRIIQPRLELLLESRDTSMEITSPGIDRRIKSNREYPIFKGKALKILLEGESEWKSGWIRDCSEDSLVLEQDDKEWNIPMNTIRKAKLDYTMEARQK